jgi:translin
MKKTGPASLTSSLNELGEQVRLYLSRQYEAREQALKLCRDAIRCSANSIRAVHRSELPEARRQLQSAGDLIRQAEQDLQPHPELYYAGFLADAQKEYAEASILLALLTGEAIPRPERLGMAPPPYLNGLGEAVGELRRHLLDQLRRGSIEKCESILSMMDDIYSLLTTIDFPDSLTHGLRRTTDMVRGVLERTRGDATLTSIEARLSSRLEAHQAAATTHPGSPKTRTTPKKSTGKGR